MSDWNLTQNMIALIWLLGGIVLFMAELAIPGVILVFFGLGAIITALLVWLGVLSSLSMQLLVFCVVSLISLALLRRYFAKTLQGKVQQASEFDENEEFRGAHVRVCRAIEPGSAEGRVIFQGSEWKAVSTSSIAEGELAAVLRKENITLHVDPVA